MTLDYSDTRQALHQLVDQLPGDQVAAALRYINDLRADPVLLSLLSAPEDDEPYTEEQRARDAEAESEFARGDYRSHESLLKEFGLSESGGGEPGF